MIRRLKLLIADFGAPNDIRSWSGTPYHLADSLRAKFDISLVGGLPKHVAFGQRGMSSLHKILNLGVYRGLSEPELLDQFGRRLRASIARERPDAVLSIGCEPIARHKMDVPAFLVHDATFRQLSETYPNFQNLCRRSRLSGEQAQIEGFNRAAAILSASQWAKSSVCKDYGVDGRTTFVIPMGANLNNIPPLTEIGTFIESRLLIDGFDFLFVGVDWERKGGDAAVRIIEAIRNRGYSARLHIVGCRPPRRVLERSFVISYGFLSKNRPHELALLESLLRTARFLIMPSIAEAYGCVLCEASAYGLPSIARAVGAIPEIVRHGETGLLLSDSMNEEQMVESVGELLEDDVRYRNISINARRAFDDHLNWTSYSMSLEAVMKVVLGSRGGYQPNVLEANARVRQRQ